MLSVSLIQKVSLFQVATWGFSEQAKRTVGGPPILTSSKMPDSVRELAVPTLARLTEVVTQLGYSPNAKRASLFADQLLKGNFFEAMAVGVTDGATDVVPHVDRMNGHEHGYTIMAALTYTRAGRRVAIFGYTRKVCGDHLRKIVS